MSLVRRSLSMAGLASAAARSIVAAERNRLPDLSAVTVVLPTLHAAPDFARALARESGTPLLLPRLTTLREWAETVPVAVERVSDSQRELRLYDALRERGWFEEGDLWVLTRELRDLADELTLHRVAPADTLEAFVARLEGAYQARAGESMLFEARLAFESWRALADGGDSAAVYAVALARLAGSAAGPLYLLDPDPLSPAETAFLEAYVQRAPVVVLEGDPLAEPQDPMAALLATAWPLQADQAAPLHARSQTCKAAWPTSPLRGRLALFRAAGLEEEAEAVDLKVRAWLAEGRSRVAVVTQDRLTARRLRALLERAQVLVQDETGWTLSTVAASTVVMRWLDCIGSDFYHRELLDLLKSPYFLADGPPDRRKEFVFHLEQLVRKEGVISGLRAYLSVARQRAEGLVEPLELLDRAAARLRPGRRTLQAWLGRLRESLDLLGITAGLQADAAGQQLLALLMSREDQARGETTLLDFSEWRRWLDATLEADMFRDRDIRSPVVFTHLAATRLREFDGVALLGCDSAHLPGEAGTGLFFNHSVRAALGLPVREAALARQRLDLIGVICAAREVFVTWQGHKLGEDNLLSPYFELLQALHEQAYGDDLLDRRWAGRIPHARLAVDAGAVAARPLHAPPKPAAPGLVPDRVSVSAYNSLVACPYQFFARHMLRLNELDEVREELEKRDYGEVVHEILHRFHQRFPVARGQDRAMLEKALRELSDTVFAERMSADYLAHAWALRWESLIASYLDWQEAREEEGWQYVEGEAPRERALPLPGAAAVTLHGRIDRLERSETDAGPRYAVLDYKVIEVNGLRRRLREPGEDVQLPGYALLQGEVTEAAFLSVNKDRVQAVPVPHAIGDLAQLAGERLMHAIARLRGGAGLPAQGDDAVCEHCEMRALCRRDYWGDD